ncbi:hypothetical protein PFISCL1PPCAC_9649 [Pristionchus fissidentatus]|uniref:F-box domain-containing protein n=1 Tax=Pristionchus fissidentatus TaxID=1538716 RepID=A0AAV5VF58_9BILA|nr:hypothetical protein PFISCL1PPCAC_9649 [Pristionchus fissidentatus]
MESGDQPTCSKYLKHEETEPESDEASLEHVSIHEFSPWQLDVPSTFTREVADVLPILDLKYMRLVCRTWTTFLEASLQKYHRFGAAATHYKWEPIHYAHSLYHPRIYPRMFHCGAHHPMTEKIYMFGGNGPQKTLDNLDFEAHFNDVWTFDVRRKQWERLFVPAVPYPMPKSRSTLLPWREYLVLFGGFRRPDKRHSMRQGSDMMVEYANEQMGAHQDEPDYLHGRLPNEVHFLNVNKNVWETATPVIREGCIPPFGLHGHSAAIYDKWMIVFGGLTSTPWEHPLLINDTIHFFDLEDKIWHKANQANGRDAEQVPTNEEIARGSLTLIRPGRLLYHPCFPIRYPLRGPPVVPIQNAVPAPYAPPLPANPLPHQMLNAPRDGLKCYLLDFNPADLFEPWKWTSIPVASPHLLRPTGPLAPPVAVRHGDRVKLINAVVDTPRTRRDIEHDKCIGLQNAAAHIRHAVQSRVNESTPIEFYDSLARQPFEIELNCEALYRHIDLSANPSALKVCISVLQGRSGHIGDYKVRVRLLDEAWAHVHTKGSLNFIEQATIGFLPTKGGSTSPHHASISKTLAMVRQSARKMVKLVQADITDLDESGRSQLTWREMGERPAHEEWPVPSVGLMMTQADGMIFITGGEAKPDEEGNIDTSIGGGTWIANPVK